MVVTRLGGRTFSGKYGWLYVEVETMNVFLLPMKVRDIIRPHGSHRQFGYPTKRGLPGNLTPVDI